MKKNYLFLLLLIAAASGAYSQQLIPIPNDSVEISANVTEEFDPNDSHIKVINNTAWSVTITWGMLNYTAPSQWEVKLCDNNNCYDLLLNAGPHESLPVAAGDTMDMKSQYTAHLITGTGITNIYAYVTGDSVNSVVFLNYKANLTYTPNGIADNFSAAHLKLYPNPVQRSFVVSGFGNLKNLSFEVYDIKGAVMKTKILNASDSQLEISVENLPAGEYFLKVFDSFGKMVGAAQLNKVD